EAHLGPHILEDWRNVLDLKVLVERLALVAAFRAIAFVGANETAPAVAAFTILQTDVTESFFRRPGNVLRGLLFAPPGNVVITRYRIVRAASQHLVDRHAGALPLDVPQRFVHGGDHLVIDRTASPVSAEIGALPQVLDTVGIFTDKPGLQML